MKRPALQNEWVGVLRMAVWVSRLSKRGPLNANAKKNAVFIKTQKISMWKIIHGCLNIWNFSSSVELDISWVSCAHSLDIELNRRNAIPYLQSTIYSLVYYINILVTRRSRLNLCSKRKCVAIHSCR